MSKDPLQKPTQLRKAKAQLRAQRRRLTLPEKVAQVVELQRAILPAVRQRRPLKPIEKVWNL